jgi:alkylhydroperoxidase family enzyme
MPRLRQVPRAEATDPVVVGSYDRIFGPTRDPVAEPGTESGTPGTWWTTFALVPDVLKHLVRSTIVYQSTKRLLPPHLRELGQIRAGWLVGSEFVYSQHVKSARGVGMSEEKIQAIKSWSVSDLFEPVERALLGYTDALTLQYGRVPDDVFRVLREHLSDEQIVEFSYITTMYIQQSILSRALKLEFDDTEDPCVEHPSPEGFDPAVGLSFSGHGK